MLRQPQRLLHLLLAGIPLLALTSLLHPAIAQRAAVRRPYRHVLILSIDGLRQADLTNPTEQPSLPNLLQLTRQGVTYTHAYTSIPSDSFPGTLNYVTGASPKTTGVYYDDTYDRLLVAPGGSAASSHGTEVAFDESIDKQDSLLSGGGSADSSSIDPAKLPLACNPTCTPLYPHSYLKVNTIFEVAKAAGLHTAFIDKHPAYDLVNGPSGKGVDDLYTPEIEAKVAIENGKLVDAATATNPGSLTFQGVTKSVTTTEAYDDLKVNALINQIRGLDARGTAHPGMPAIFGMNFQAVSVAQKDRASGGINANGVPATEMKDALKHTDASIGRILTALERNNQLSSTLVIITAKHGQAPRMGAATLVSKNLIPDALKAAGIEVAQATQDNVALLWLKDQRQAGRAAQAIAALKASNSRAGILQVMDGSSLNRAGLGNPATNPRTPDLVVTFQPNIVVVSNPADSNKRAEHGGFSEDNTHVVLLVTGGLAKALQNKTFSEQVSTKQIAVTTLAALGLEPSALQGARAEQTQILPGLGLSAR